MATLWTERHANGVDWLVDQVRAQRDAGDDDGWLVDDLLGDAAWENDEEAIGALVALGGDLDLAYGRVFIEAAVRADFPRMTQLLASGTDINFRDASGTTALEDVVARLPEEAAVGVLDWLLKNGADIHLAGSNGATVLHFAAASGKKRIVEHLLDKGAQVHVQDSSYQTVLDYAVTQDQHDVVALLLRRLQHPER